MESLNSCSGWWLQGCQMILALHMLMLFCIELIPITWCISRSLMCLKCYFCITKAIWCNQIRKKKISSSSKNLKLKNLSGWGWGWLGWTAILCHAWPAINACKSDVKTGPQIHPNQFSLTANVLQGKNNLKASHANINWKKIKLVLF